MRYFSSITFCFILLAISLESSGQVTLQTGSPSYDISLFNYTNGDNLTVNVGLSYTGGRGIKVNDVPSCVGLGWTLKAGGSITRVTAGKPDDQYGNFGYYKEKTGRMYGPDDGTLLDCYSDINTQREYFGWDREADIFVFNFNGRSGSFIIGRKRDGDQEYPIQVLNDTRMKVKLVEEDMSASNIITRISKFIITSEDGVEYTFSEKELTELLTTDPNMAVNPPSATSFVVVKAGQSLPAQDQITLTPYNSGKYQINNWYLSEMKNLSTGQKILFNYEGYPLDISLQKLPIKTALLNSDGVEDNINYTIINQRFSGTAKRIKLITMPEGQQVQFIYDNNRIDIAGESFLKSIAIRSNESGDSLINGYKFNYYYNALGNMFDYDTATSVSASYQSYARPFLKSIQRDYHGTEPFLNFTYKYGAMPPRSNFNQDIYGYNLGSTSLILTADKFFDQDLRQPAAINTHIRNSQKIAAQFGMIDKIQFPGGGYIQYDYEDNMVRGGTVAVYGGVRVKQTTVYDGIDHNRDQITTYKYLLEDGTSSGTGYEDPIYTKDLQTYYVSQGTHLGSKIFVLAANLALTAYTGNTGTFIGSAAESTGFLKLVDDIISFFVGTKIETNTANTRTWSGYPLTSMNPLPFFYSRVSVIKGTEDNNLGTEVTEFTDFNDRAPIDPVAGRPYAFSQRVEDWAVGLPKTITTYDPSGNKLKETVNNYAFISAYNQDTVFVSCKCDEYKSVSPYNIQSDLSNKIFFYKNIYYPLSGRAEVSKTTERTYYLNNNNSTKTTYYEYDPSYFNLKKQITITSINDKIETLYYYPYDFDETGVMGEMIKNNLIGTQIGTETWLIKRGTERKLLAANYTEFSIQSNGAIKPKSVLEFQSEKPISESVIGVFNGSLNRAPDYFKEIAQYKYDLKGNLSEINNKGNRISYIYDNNHRKIAEIANASNSETAFSDFEVAGFDSWTYAGERSIDLSAPMLIAPGPFTGTYFYQTNNGSISKQAAGMVPGKKYKIVYWSTSALTINPDPATLNYASTITKLGRYNGYTCYQHEFTMGSNDIILSGSVSIDQLRLFPSDAFVTTYVYDPFGNIITSIDNNNLINIYRYDNKRRPVGVFNQMGDMLKAFEYKN